MSAGDPLKCTETSAGLRTPTDVVYHLPDHALKFDRRQLREQGLQHLAHGAFGHVFLHKDTDVVFKLGLERHAKHELELMGHMLRNGVKEDLVRVQKNVTSNSLFTDIVHALTPTGTHAKQGKVPEISVLVSERMDMPLHTFIHTCAYRDEWACPIASQLAAAVLHLHDMGVCHLDLTLGNIMLSRKRPFSCAPVVKIIDFGNAGCPQVPILPAQVCRFSGRLWEPTVPWRFRAPEGFSRLRPRFSMDVGKRADLWALGVNLVLLLEHSEDNCEEHVGFAVIRPRPKWPSDNDHHNTHRDSDYVWWPQSPDARTVHRAAGACRAFYRKKATQPGPSRGIQRAFLTVSACLQPCTKCRADDVTYTDIARCLEGGDPVDAHVTSPGCRCTNPDTWHENGWHTSGHVPDPQHDPDPNQEDWMEPGGSGCPRLASEAEVGSFLGERGVEQDTAGQETPTLMLEKATAGVAMLTREQTRNWHWWHWRSGRATASHMHEFLCKSETSMLNNYRRLWTTPEKVRERVNQTADARSSAPAHGLLFEPYVVEILREVVGFRQLKTTGLILHPDEEEFHMLGASPDAVFSDMTGFVEVKCHFSATGVWTDLGELAHLKGKTVQTADKNIPHFGLDRLSTFARLPDPSGANTRKRNHFAQNNLYVEVSPDIHCRTREGLVRAEAYIKSWPHLGDETHPFAERYVLLNLERGSSCTYVLDYTKDSVRTEDGRFEEHLVCSLHHTLDAPPMAGPLAVPNKQTSETEETPQVSLDEYLPAFEVKKGTRSRVLLNPLHRYAAQVVGTCGLIAAATGRPCGEVESIICSVFNETIRDDMKSDRDWANMWVVAEHTHKKLFPLSELSSLPRVLVCTNVYATDGMVTRMFESIKDNYNAAHERLSENVPPP